MKLSSSNIKKFLQKKAFLIFLETETPKKLFIFQEIELSYILRNGNPKKPFSVSGNRTFQAQQKKQKKNKTKKEKNLGNGTF